MSRKRWVYTEGGRPLPEPIEVSDDWQNRTERTDVVTDLYMDGARATDGTDIGSRSKRREYMRRHNLADADDFKQTWAKAKAERGEFFAGRTDRAARREAIARAIHTQRKR